MPPDAEPRSKHTPAEQEYLDSLSARQLMDFRNYLFAPTYIALNSAKFLDHEWVDIGELRKYLQHTATNSGFDGSTRLSTIPAPVRIKVEAAPPSVSPGTAPVVKTEPQAINVPTQLSVDIKMRALNEDGREVFELLSDSEPADDHDSDLEVIDALQHASRSSSAIPMTDTDHVSDDDEAVASLSSNLADPNHFTDNESDSREPDTSSGADMDSSDDASGLEESETVWEDDTTSLVRTGKFVITQKVKIKRLEYRVGPTVIYPIHRTPTAIVVDLSDARARNPTTKELYTLNTIIMNADNDSWVWLGGAREGAKVTFAPGEKPIDCQRFRYKCKGAYACSEFDTALRSVERFELDPAPRNAIIAAQQETRRREGNTQEERVALFVTLVRRATCPAVNPEGNKCRGGPVLKPKRQGSSRGHQYFVGCSGWTPKFKDGHRTHFIPDNVDENLLANALAGRPLTDDPTKDTPPCSGLIHPHIGLRKKTCPHAHIVNGLQVQGKIRNYPCKAIRTIYVPADDSILKVLIVHNDTGHNHPMPTLTKVSFGHKDTYRQCIDVNGVLGATVAKIDNAPTTKQLLKGKTLTMHAAPLHNKRVKQDLLHAAKLEKYPNGLGLDAILPMYHAELTKPLPERYIHSYIETKKGETIVVTFVPYLLKLLDDPGVTSFDGDTTYKGVEGKVNEWELTIFAKVVRRSASILRAYINGASTDFFEQLFDELQHVKLLVTGKPIRLKKFVRDGNLLVMNVDMDGAQALGFCRSVMKYNEPEYSGIPNDTPPEEIASEFIKLYWRHGKEPIHDFASLVSPEQLARIKNVFYLESKEALAEFSSFIYGLGIKKIADWWKHKEIHDWIIPCLIKSQSRLSADEWDATPSTTNTNEAQHHWTNSQTGIQLTPVEALESRRKVDENVAQEIQMSLRTGILVNPNNELSHCMARNNQRQSAAARRAHERAQKAPMAATTKRGKAKATTTVLSASSSGRVRTPRQRTNAPTQPAQAESDDSSNPAEVTVPTTNSEEVPMPSNSVQASVDLPSYFDFDFDSLLTSLENPHLSSSFFAPETSIDPAVFGLPGGDFNVLMPSNHYSIPTPDPLDEFLAMFGDASASNFGSSAPFIHELPSLLPPPPTSPPELPLAPSLSVEHPSEPVQRPRRGRQEVDEANIIHSTRSRAPTARKRFADGEVSDRPEKKGKSKKATQG
ncbi:hypothetical protein B0H11DRAFT_2307912 [Mycena galericulata]|nr:hypothetical protein B0H11DRAFT_2307912 [Mycena galericulata]